MTAKDYIQRYGDSTNPPKATIAPKVDDKEKDQPVTGGTYNTLKSMGLTDFEIEKYFDKPDTSNPKSIKSSVYSLKEGVTVGSKEIKSLDELIQALKEEKVKKFKDAVKAGEIKPADSTPKCVDPLSGKLITVELFNQKYDNGKAVLQVHIPRGNGMAMLETMTAKDYIQRYGNYANPPKAFRA